jgi:hypothetical protein
MKVETMKEIYPISLLLNFMLGLRGDEPIYLSDLLIA